MQIDDNSILWYAPAGCHIPFEGKDHTSPSLLWMHRTYSTSPPYLPAETGSEQEIKGSDQKHSL